ncbi:MAG: sulfatase-like hydrolase/transferase, partial [Planctomycetota bacterium]
MSDYHITRRSFLKTTGVSAAALMTTSSLIFSQQTVREKPNVILIMPDDQGYGDLACHGNPVIKTPNLDKLYSDSVRLTDFHVCPTCSPTRASVMTGRYCNRTGVWHTIMGRSLLRKDELTMADVFAAGGYRTGIFGKWHLGDNYPFRPHDRGFDESLVHGGGAIGNSPDYWGNDYFDDTYFHNGKAKKFEGYCTDVWFDQAIKFIEANKTRPFFCYIPTNAAHGPFLVPEKYSSFYEEKGIESPLAEFYGMITNIDENIGRLRGKLDKLGISDNTIVIFTTDNGSGPWGVPEYNAGMRGAKGSEYEGGHRVPFFIYWPSGNLTGGWDVNHITAHIDILPTLIDICGLSSVPGVNFDGLSLIPLLKTETQSWPDRTIVTDSQRLDHPLKWRRCAIMTDRWRLINGEELYDIKADPGQKEDVSDKHPQVVEKLRQDYENWWDSVSERFDEYCHIIVGSEKENPSFLTTHDIHGQVMWDQSQVREGERTDGFWAVEVDRPGTYEISLRRWPKEANKTITEQVSIQQMEP